MRAVPAIAGERLVEAIGRDFAGHTGQADKFDAVSEKFGRAAFVGQNVRLGVAKNGAPGRRDLCQRQSVCRRAGRHQESRYVTLEDLTEPALRGFCPIIIAVATRVAAKASRMSGATGAVLSLAKFIWENLTGTALSRRRGVTVRRPFCAASLVGARPRRQGTSLHFMLDVRAKTR